MKPKPDLLGKGAPARRSPSALSCVGRVVPIRVFVDGAEVLSRIDMLDNLPPDELYTVEVLGGGRWIRAYTNWFMDTVSEVASWSADAFL